MTQQLTVPIDGEEKRALLQLCLIAAKQTGFIMPDDTDIRGERLLSLYREWGGDQWARNFKPMAGVFLIEDAAGNFLTFCKKKAGELQARLVKRDIQITELSVSMFVPLGEKGGFTYGVKCVPPPDMDKEEILDAFNIMMNKSILGYEQQLNNPVNLPTKERYKGVSGDTANTFDFTSIRTRSEGGKRGFFVKGGAFTKYGVRVFPEVLAKAGFDIEKIDGELYIAGTCIYTVKANGDPDLVVSMTKGVGL